MSRIIRRVDDLSSMLDPARPVVTLFSGGLDGTYLLHMLAERKFRRVTALVVDLGAEIDLEQVGAVAAGFGAEITCLDRRAEFLADCVLPAIRAHAVYLGGHPISASLSRPVIAQAGLTLAERLGAQAIVHSANQSQNTLRRLNGALSQLGYEGYFGTPFERSAIARGEKRRALQRSGVPMVSGHDFSVDANLWCREFESGTLDDPEDFEIPERLFRWSVPVPDEPDREVEISFREGQPTGLDGQEKAAADLISELNCLAGRYGIGRYVGLEHLASGHKVLEAREAPAAALLLSAFRQLESATVDAETIREKLRSEQVWVREAVEGRWFGPLREAVDAFVASVARAITGTVRMRMTHRGAAVTAIRAPRGLYIACREDWEAQQADRWEDEP